MANRIRVFVGRTRRKGIHMTDKPDLNTPGRYWTAGVGTVAVMAAEPERGGPGPGRLAGSGPPRAFPAGPGTCRPSVRAAPTRVEGGPARGRYGRRPARRPGRVPKGGARMGSSELSD
jgi:hypothetical protein